MHTMHIFQSLSSLLIFQHNYSKLASHYGYLKIIPVLPELQPVVLKDVNCGRGDATSAAWGGLNMVDCISSLVGLCEYEKSKAGN